MRWPLTARQLPEELSLRWVVLLTTLLGVTAAALRFYDLDHSVHIDSFAWFKRTNDFWAALRDGNLSETYRMPHPGVTYMWLAGLCMKAVGALNGQIEPATLIAAKVPVAAIGVLSAALTFPLLLTATDKRHWLAALFTAALLATEPYAIELSRMVHLDMMAVGLTWLGLLVTMLAHRRDSTGWAVLAGVLFGAGCLTRLSMAPIAATTALALAGSSLASGLAQKRGLRIAAIVAVAALVTAFLIWPALWVEPIHTLKRMLQSTEELVAEGHVHRIGGQLTEDPGALFYASAAASLTPYETLPLALVGLLGFYAARDLLRAYALPLVPLLAYCVVIALAPKKLSRYLLPLIPLFALLGGVALEWLARNLSRLRAGIPALAVALAALFGVRYSRAAASLPAAHVCTQWPGLASACESQRHMYSVRDVARVIKADWRHAAKKGKPVVYTSFRTRMLSPWLRHVAAKDAKRADYVVLWYTDEHTTRLSRRTKAKLKGTLGPALHELRDGADVVARIFVGPRQRPRLVLGD